MKIRLIAIFAALAGIAAAFTFAPGAHADVGCDDAGICYDEGHIYGGWDVPVVNATTSNGTVELTWAQSSHHVWKARHSGGYNVSYREAGSGDFKSLGSVGQDETLAFEHTPGGAGTYEYRISGYITTDRYGNTLPRTLISNPGPATEIEVFETVAAPPKPGKPSGQVSTLGTANGPEYSVVISWTTDPSHDGWHVWRDGTYLTRVDVNPALGPDFPRATLSQGADTGIFDGNEHTFQVQAIIDLEDGGTVLSERSEIGTVTAPLTPELTNRAAQ